MSSEDFPGPTLLDLAAVRNCYTCGACVSDCPVAEITPRFDPNRLIGEVLDGKINALLERGDFWLCVECHTCYELCPQKFGMEKVFNTLKPEFGDIFYQTL